jgi:hypothetical protein
MKRVLFVFLGMFLIGMVLFFAIDWYHPIANPEAWGRAWGRFTALLVIATAVYEVGRHIIRTGRPSKDPPLPWAAPAPPAPSDHQALSEPAAMPPVPPARQASLRAEIDGCSVGGRSARAV